MFSLRTDIEKHNFYIFALLLIAGVLLFKEVHQLKIRVLTP